MSITNAYDRYLFNPTVLKYVDNLLVKTQFIRMTILNWQDKPIKTIEGRATAGSISINNNSAVRRTGSLTLVTEVKRELNNLEIMNMVSNTDTLISMNKRVSIEIGIQNSGSLYQDWDVFWFPLGVFIISNASVSYNNNGIQISVKLNDKMSLLNGDAGGTISGSGILSPDADNNPVTFYDLIFAIVHNEGAIPADKIAIELLKTTPGGYVAAGADSYYYIDNNNTLKEVLSYPFVVVKDSKTQIEVDKETYDLLEVNDIIYFYNKIIATVAAKTENTEKSKYIITLNSEQDFDKLKKVFWIEDLSNATWANKNETLCNVMKQSFVYPGTFSINAGDTVVSVLDNIKNKLGNYEYFFDIKGIFHFREIRNSLQEGSSKDNLADAINEQFFLDTSKDKIVYSFNESNLISAYNNAPQYNQIKNDYNVWGQMPNTKTPIHYHLIIDNLPTSVEKVWWTVTEGTDEGGNVIYTSATSYNEDPNTDDKIKLNDAALWRQKLYLMAVESQAKDSFSMELRNKLPLIMDLSDLTQNKFKEEEGATKLYFLDGINTNDASLIQKVPVKQFAISNIGKRTKTITDNNVNCIFPLKPPTEAKFMDDNKTTIITVDAVDPVANIISYSNSYNSAYDALRTAVHQYLAYNNSITVTSMPIYHLDVNERIEVNNNESDIHGHYMIQSISIPLTVDGMMTINATQAIERI